MFKIRKYNCFAKDNKQFFDKFNYFKWEVIVRVVDIGGIVDHRCLHNLFIVQKVFTFFASTTRFKFAISLLVISAHVYIHIYFDNVDQYFSNINENTIIRRRLKMCNIYLFWIRKDMFVMKQNVQSILS